MATPGITIKPIITLAGDHEVNQVFFDDVRVPRANRVGQENDGWTVAKYLLEFERGNAYAAVLRVALDKTRDLAKVCGLGQDDDFSRKLAQVEIDLTAIEMTEHRIMSAISKGGNPGPESSMLKACGTEMQQRIGELGVEALGHYAAPDQFAARQPHANVPVIGPVEGLITVPSYLNNRAASIYGGSNEIQRNIMAKMVLGL